MNPVFFFLIFWGIAQQKYVEKNLYFTNVEENDDIVLYGYSLPTTISTEKEGTVEKFCNFGSYPAFRLFGDHENSRIGTGNLDYYSIFLHDNEKDRNSGIIKTCYLPNKTVSQQGIFNFSCEFMSGGMGPYGYYFYCLKTGLEETEKTSKLYYVDERGGAQLWVELPFVGGKEAFCAVDENWDEITCALFNSSADRKAFSDESAFEIVRIECDYKQKSYELFAESSDREFISFKKYSFYASKTDGWKALMKEGLATIEFDWNERKITYDIIGHSANYLDASYVPANFFETCYLQKLAFVKVQNKAGAWELIQINADSGEDKIVDLGISDLTFVSNPICV